MTHNRLTYGRADLPPAQAACSPATGGERPAVLRLLLVCAILALAAVLAIPFHAAGATPPGTLITNQAQAAFTSHDLPQVVPSNIDTIIVKAPAVPATIALYRYAGGAPADLSLPVGGTAFSPSGNPTGPFTPLPPPVGPGYPPLDLGAPLPLRSTPYFHAGEPVFIVVTDLAANANPTAVDTITVETTSSSGDKEVLRLVETGPNTGVFAGYIQTVPQTATPILYDGRLSATDSAQLVASYQEASDRSIVLTASALVDPTGRVFDSTSGLPVNGATVTLLDATGNPATVLGDDGVSIFPATVTTGATAIDSSGRHYDFPPGAYRFPLIPPGSYRLKITPPANYQAPSSVPDSILQSLAGEPFNLSPASRGETFTVNPGPIVRVDIPVDPMAKGLWIQKLAGKTTAAVGDFVPFLLQVTNVNPNQVTTGVVVTDVLPPGLRYRQGSLRLNGLVAANPLISPDGAVLQIPVGDMQPSATIQISYVTEVGVGVQPGTVINLAYAQGGGIRSNNATASVQITQDFFSSRSFLMGTVTAGPCGTEGSGVGGARIFLENGTYVVTDKKGMFHFENVLPGTHVVQLDVDSLPEGYQVIACEENDRFAGRAFSQFVDLQGGTLWRTDFRVIGPSPVKAASPAATAAPAGTKAVTTGDLSPAPQAKGEVSLELNSSLQNETISYQVVLRGKRMGQSATSLIMTLPEGVTYSANSSQLDGAPLADPSIQGARLIYPLGNRSGDWSGELRLRATLSRDGKPGELLTRTTLDVAALAVAGQPAPTAENLLRRVREESRIRLPELILQPHFPSFGAALSNDDKSMIDALGARLTGVEIEAGTVTGHADSVRIASRSRNIYPDNDALSLARAESVSRYLIEALHLQPEILTVTGMGNTMPAADNKTPEGRALNRRVEVKLQPEKVVESTHLEMVKEQSGVQKAELPTPPPLPSPALAATATPGTGTPAEPQEDATDPPQDTAAAGTASSTAQPANGQEPATAPQEDDEKLPAFDEAWIETVQPGRDWVWPPPTYFPPVPSTHIAIRHLPTDKVELMANGEAVDPILLEKVIKQRSGAVAVTYWRGIHLKEGDNRIVAQIQQQGSTEKITLERVLHVSTSPVRAELVPELSRLVADGKKPPVIALRLFDKDDFPARPGMTGKYTISSPYEAYKDLDQPKMNEVALKDDAATKYVVGKEGVVLIQLQPTNRTGEVAVTIPMANRDEQYRAWLVPQQRDWILVGLAEGTAGYNAVSGHIEDFTAAGGDEHLYENGRLAFYAKGSIQGKWLLTMAYDSAKRTTDVGNSLFQTVDPNAFYTLYGDGTQQMYDAASSKTLYLKIEREQFYAMFGDFDTGLTVTELSRYSRSLTGFKSEYHGKRFEYNVFASETGQAFVRDEIRGDGTSGLYHLSHRNIVQNSDKITIEVRDRFRSEVIISSQPLSRYLDYTIDTDSGTLFFKMPINSRDENFNPIYIVVDYETRDAGSNSLNAGGRVGAKFLDETVKTGFTYIHEGQVTGQANSYGLDGSWQINSATKVRAELARTDSDIAGDYREGNAYLAELAHRSSNLDGTIYYRQLDPGFGLGQQNQSESGTRKMGFDTAYRLADSISVTGQAYRQYNLNVADNSVRDLIESKFVYTDLQYSARLGVRYASDHLGDGSTKTSEQLTMGGSWLTLNKKLTLHVDHDQSIGNNANTDFPTRTTVGADYKVSEKLTLFANQEFTYGQGKDTNTTRLGMKSTPWQGGSLNSSMERDLNENGDRLFALFGLKQTWKLTEQWSADASLDRSQTVRNIKDYTFNVNVPPASGGEDFTAISLGTTYKEKTWNWSTRLETRQAHSEDKWGVQTAFVGEPREGWAWSSRLQAFDTKAADGSGKVNGDLRLGLVYRPFATRWIILDRLDLIYDRLRAGTALNTVTPVTLDTATAGTVSDLNSRRIVNNLNANFRPDKKTQISLQYGAKYVMENANGVNCSGFTDLVGIEGRYDLTKEWDIGLRGSVLHSWQLHQVSYSSGVSVGYNVVQNSWVSIGYNFLGFTDKDFSATNYTARGPFIRFRAKFDQNSVRDAVNWITHD